MLRGSRFQRVSREREREQFAGVFIRVPSTAEYLVVCWTISIARAGFKSLPRNPSTRRKRNIVVGTKIVCTEQFPISRSLSAYFLEDFEISLVRELRFIRVKSTKHGERYCNIIRGDIDTLVASRAKDMYIISTFRLLIRELDVLRRRTCMQFY